jgi:hypothetical protein
MVETENMDERENEVIFDVKSINYLERKTPK